MNPKRVSIKTETPVMRRAIVAVMRPVLAGRDGARLLFPLAPVPIARIFTSTACALRCKCNRAVNADAFFLEVPKIGGLFNPAFGAQPNRQ
jgi:hypothetical protein